MLGGSGNRIVLIWIKLKTKTKGANQAHPKFEFALVVSLKLHHLYPSLNHEFPVGLFESIWPSGHYSIDRFTRGY